MIKVGLAAVEFDYPNDLEGANFDSLRDTFCTLFARSGVQPQIARKLILHSSIDLTVNFYSHILMEDKMSAVSQ